ncbi:rab-3A-interacting protein isoform X2 [Hypanus sabinus]|uniref:rab-3A-interacting protein isoform X2 n=1 Tax=Hypanus sabinus TaxID=79690 RepID=UPI0028C4D147|nr:rab-3A-interacting protein isoform X2 [Hypanus sabinus]
MASNTLEGFHEVNLASPSSPDYTELAQSETTEAATSGILYHPHLLVSSTPVEPCTLIGADLPTQPIYPSSQNLSSGESRNVSNKFPMLCATSETVHNSPKPLASDIGNHRAEVEFLQGVLANEVQEGTEDVLDQSTDSLSHLRSPIVLEVREKGYERLKEELAKAQRELKLKDEECERLSKVRDQLGQELEELTASLFEEAHKMVREANVKQAAAEKQLKEAHGKIEVLQAEVAALKTLVQSSSPTSPMKELQLNAKPHFKKGHARNKSTSAMASCSQEMNMIQPIVRDCKELASTILEAVEGNTLSIEPVVFQPLPVVKASAVECGGPKKCALSGQTKTCKHRIRLGDSSSYYYVSPFCRYRIMSVCNFFTYIRYIQQGLLKQQDVEQMFWEVMHLRKEMSLAKLGFYKEEL